MEFFSKLTLILMRDDVGCVLVNGPLDDDLQAWLGMSGYHYSSSLGTWLHEALPAIVVVCGKHLDDGDRYRCTVVKKLIPDFSIKTTPLVPVDPFGFTSPIFIPKITI